MRPITNTGMPADWVDNETYTLLLNIFAINHARVFTSMDVITLAGDITNTSSGGFDKAMYVAHGGLIDNASDYSTGNVNVVALNAQGAIIYNYSYAPTFAIAFSGGELGTTNKSSFVFKIPRSNISSIRLYKDGQLLDSRTISQNAPITNLTAPQSGRVYEGLFNVTWNSSDVDGDPTYQAVLLSADSGQTWTPLGIDINGSHFAMDTSGYAPGSNYKLQLLSTDGVNTNATFSGTFTMIPPPHIAVLNITELYGDGSREVFEADAKNDGVYYNLSTVNWTLNTGTELLSGAKYNTLAVGEQMDVLVEYNYASSGTQIVVFTARDDNKSVADFKSISVNVGGQTNNPLLSCNFVGTNCNFTGFANHNSIAGYIEETENWSDSIVSPGLNLSSLSAYHFVIKAELGHVGITKLWFKANNAADSGPDYIFDDAGSTMNWKFEGDSYSTISNIPLNRNITITVYVNSTSNKTYSTLDWGDGSGTTANQTFVNTNYDYARFSVGQIFQAPVRIRSWEVWNDALNSSLSNSSNGSQTPSALLKNYTFTSSNEEFALNSGWNWDRGAGILRYNGSDNGGTLASPSVNLSKYPNGYNITLVLSTGNITNTKLYINSPNGGLAGARYNMEHATDTTQHFKYDGGSWSSTDDYSIGTYQTMLISVNLTSNMTKVCRVGGTCSNSEAMGTYTVGDYFGIVPGVVMNGTQDINITTIEIWAIS
jgi:hypothetical protein